MVKVPCACVRSGREAAASLAQGDVGDEGLVDVGGQAHPESIKLSTGVASVPHAPLSLGLRQDETRVDLGGKYPEEVAGPQALEIAGDRHHVRPREIALGPDSPNKAVCHRENRGAESRAEVGLILEEGVEIGRDGQDRHLGRAGHVGQTRPAPKCSSRPHLLFGTSLLD